MNNRVLVYAEGFAAVLNVDGSTRVWTGPGGLVKASPTQMGRFRHEIDMYVKYLEKLEDWIEVEDVFEKQRLIANFYVQFALANG